MNSETNFWASGLTELSLASTEATASTLYFEFPRHRRCQARPTSTNARWVLPFPHTLDVRSLL